MTQPDPVHTEVYKGFTINIHHDADYEDDLQADAVFLVTTNNRHFHHKGPLGLETPEDVSRYYILDDGGTSPYDRDRAKGGGYEVFALYAYIHGGVAFSLGAHGCSFDSGQAGFVLVDRAAGWSTKPGVDLYELMRRAAEATVSHQNDINAGNVYGYEVVDQNGEQVDSCWGFVGDYDDEGPLVQARLFVDSYAEVEQAWKSRLLEGTGGAEQLGQHLDGLIQSTLFDEFSSHLQKSNDDKIAWLKANGHDAASIEEDVRHA